jgi:DNA-binding CsgD family transcriptional regulator
MDATQSAGVMLERLVDRLFLRALQCVLAGVLFGIVFFPVRGRGSAVELATAAALVTLATAALVCRSELLELLRRRPATTLLFPIPALVAVTLDGGFDSVWTPLVAATVGVPATLGLPWLSLGCSLIAASGQAGAAWINRADTSSDRLIETAVFSAIGTVAAGVGIALAVVTLVIFLQRRPRVLTQLRQTDLLLRAPRERADRAPAQPLLGPAPRTPLSPAELHVVTLLAAGRRPKDIAADLFVAVSTVRSHLKAAKRKTHARTLPELVGLFILEEGQL